MARSKLEFGASRKCHMHIRMRIIFTGTARLIVTTGYIRIHAQKTRAVLFSRARAISCLVLRRFLKMAKEKKSKSAKKGANQRVRPTYNTSKRLQRAIFST